MTRTQLPGGKYSRRINFFTALLLRAYMTTVQKCLQPQPYNPEFSVSILNICRKEHFSASI